MSAGGPGGLVWVGVSWREASSGRRAGLVALDRVVPGGVAIHTCARDAWLVGGAGAVEVVGGLRGRLAERGLAPEVLTGGGAAGRLLSVAVGLDSAVEGEADVGRQVRAALADREELWVRTVDHVVARVLRQGRLRGWVREGHGVARLAAREALRGADGPGGPEALRIGVVGAGAMGTAVASILGERARLYSRTPRAGVRALAELEPAGAWVVATSAREAWFVPPGPCATIVDLGHPAQALPDPRVIGLDALLAGAQARLDPTLRAMAKLAVADAAEDLVERLVGTFARRARTSDTAPRAHDTAPRANDTAPRANDTAPGAAA